MIGKVFNQSNIAAGVAVLVVFIAYGFVRRALPAAPPAGN